MQAAVTFSVVVVVCVCVRVVRVGGGEGGTYNEIHTEAALCVCVF